MNIPFTVLRTDIAGEEDWSIAVKKEHANKVPSGFKLQEYRPGNGEINAYETQYPYTHIRYFVPNDEQLDNILNDIASGDLQMKLSSPLGNVYEGRFSLKEEIVAEREHLRKFERFKKMHKAELDRLPSDKAKYKYKMLTAPSLAEHFNDKEISKILGLSAHNVAIALGPLQEVPREEKMILENKRKRLSRSLYRRGLNVYEIADYLDVDTDTVKRYIGDAYSDNRDSDNKLETVITMVQEGWTYQSIAEKIGCNRTSIHHYIRRYGKPLSHKTKKYVVVGNVVIFDRKTRIQIPKGKTAEYIINKYKDIIYGKIE